MFHLQNSLEPQIKEIELLRMFFNMDLLSAKTLYVGRAVYVCCLGCLDLNKNKAWNKQKASFRGSYHLHIYLVHVSRKHDEMLVMTPFYLVDFIQKQMPSKIQL